MKFRLLTDEQVTAPSALESWLAAQLKPMSAEQANNLTEEEMQELAGLPTFVQRAIAPTEPSNLVIDNSRVCMKTPTTVQGLPGFSVREASSYSHNVKQALMVDGKLMMLETAYYKSYRHRQNVLQARNWAPCVHADNLEHMRVTATEAAERYCRTRSDYRRAQYLDEVEATKKNWQMYTKAFSLSVGPLLDQRLENRVYKRQAIAKLEGTL